MPRVRPLTDVVIKRANVLAPTSSDSTLMSLIAQGDRDAMQILFRRHNVNVYRFVLRLVDNASIAEDLTVEVFLKLWRQAACSDGPPLQVSTSLLAIAHDQALFHLRSHPRSKGMNGELVRLVPQQADISENAMHVIQRTSSSREALMQLTPACREIIDLVYYHQKSVAEVAAIVDASQSIIEARLSQARERLTASRSSTKQA